MPRPSGEVAASADGEGYCRDFRPRLCVVTSFSSAEKEAKKSPVTTTAAVSRA